MVSLYGLGVSDFADRRRRPSVPWRALAALAVLTGASAAAAPPIPTPVERLGFAPGADGRLADWGSIVEYFRAVDAASDRVAVVEAGKSTEGRPYLTALISAPETIARLDEFRDRQRRLHDPRLLVGADEQREAVERSKPVVAVLCSIHSDEPAATLAAVELLHRLASESDRETLEILDGAIVLLVPSANPDGVDAVKRWYDRSRGQPWEGEGRPELYHRHAGHDVNRDWFMLNLPETRILTRVFYKEWFPTILLDLHEMDQAGPRVFVPPYRGPYNPNVDRRIRRSISVVGAHMRADLAAAGKRGVVSGALFDDWWNGGARTTPERHNIVSVLTETASVRLASPILTPAAPVRPTFRRRPSPPSDEHWPGGDWRLRDVVDCDLVCARSVLRLAARYRREFQTDLAAMARTAIDKGEREAPFAWVVPAAQRDPGTAARMLGILQDSGIEIQRAAEAPFLAGGRRFEPGDWIVFAAQPYRNHVKDLMERQRYPARIDPRGRIESPYDAAGWTLPLMMGVTVHESSDSFGAIHKRVDSIAQPAGAIVGEPAPGGGGGGGALTLDGRSNDDYRLLNRLLKAGVAVGFDASALQLRITDDPPTRARIGPLLNGLSSQVRSVLGPGPARAARVVAPRIGVYQPWPPSSDEGWTRFVLEEFEYAYQTIHNAEVQAGGLAGRFDAIVVPSVSASVLKDGYAPGRADPKYVGGLGPTGAAALGRFVESGGVLVCLADSCGYAVEALGLPVADALAGVSSDDFACPGSVLAATLGAPGRASMGMPERFSVYFDRSTAFNEPPAEARGVRVVARYASAGALESGWLVGAPRIAGKPALVEVDRGGGRVVLFGFPPQHRGWTHGTYRLLFNALIKTEDD